MKPIKTIVLTAFLAFTSQAAAEENRNACTSDLIMYHYKLDTPDQWQAYCAACADVPKFDNAASGNGFFEKDASGSHTPFWNITLHGLTVPIPAYNYTKIHLHLSPRPNYFEIYLKSEKTFVHLKIEHIKSISNEIAELDRNSEAIAWEAAGTRELFNTDTNITTLMLDSLSVDHKQISCENEQRMNDARNLYKLAFRSLWTFHGEHIIFPNHAGFLTHHEDENGRHFLEWVNITKDRKITAGYTAKDETLVKHIADLMRGRTHQKPTDTPNWGIALEETIELTEDQEADRAEIDLKIQHLKEYGLSVARN